MLGVVIGHGPSPEGQGWGPQIDAADVVVRQWDCHWQAPADYGERYDFGLLTIWPTAIAAFEKLNERQPAEWLLYDLKPRRPAPELSRPARRFRLKSAHRLALKRGGMGLTGKLTLTRGTAAAAYALQNLGLKRLVLIGFDGVRAGSLKEADRYPVACGEVGRQYPNAAQAARKRAKRHSPTKTAGHDFAVEAGVLETLAKQHKVELVWLGAGDHWP